jgi:hypothetical protein
MRPALFVWNMTQPQLYKRCFLNHCMCCDYEIPLEEEQKKTIEKEKKIMQQRSEFEKTEEEPIAV